jgi:deazaflavin-dependent oxidoreductase (nitroreductase family)
MAKNKAPLFVRAGNVVTTTLLRVGFPLVGPGLIIGKYPMYLFTVRGRKSGLPRTIPIAIIERNGQHYVGSPFGIVDWVRNLRAAGEAVLTRSRRSETVRSRELSPGEAAIILQEGARAGNPFIRPYGVTASSSMEEFKNAVLSHPVFLLERK